VDVRVAFTMSWCCNINPIQIHNKLTTFLYHKVANLNFTQRGCIMKKLLATTAMCLVFATGLHGTANANESTSVVTYDAQNFTATTIKQNVLIVETSLYRGDFQQVARATSINDLYSGMGSALMVSVRLLRY